MKDTFINRAYDRFYKKKGFIPKYFNAYNCAEIKTVAPTVTANCGQPTSSGCVLILETKEKKNE